MITIAELEKITNNCLELLACADYLCDVGDKGDEGDEAYQFTCDIFSSIRKLFIASVMYHKKLICVTGLQGAGKTTLMKNFYGLDEKYLNIARGEGERMPVMITEDDVKTPIMLAHKVVKDVNGKHELQQVKMSCEDFVEATKGKKGEENVMYLELKVPFKHTNNSGVSFFLLPGIVKNNEYLNNLIEFSVKSSDAAVMVFNDQKFATSDNADWVENISQTFGSNLVYAITGSDESSDDNKEVKQECIEALKIPADEEDRVVCVGAYNDQSKNDIWIELLKDALSKYAYGNKDRDRIKNNSLYIYEEARKIKRTLNRISLIVNADADFAIFDHEQNPFLKAFNENVDKIRDKVEEHLNDEMEEAKRESGIRLEKLFNERSKSVKGKLKTIKQFFVGKNVKEQFTETREIVEKSLVADTGYSIPNLHIGKAMQKCLIMLDCPKEKTNLGKLIDSETQNDKKVLVNSEHNALIFEDISHILTDYSSVKEPYTLHSENHNRLMGAITEISTYYYGLQVYSEIAETENVGLPYYEPAKSSINANDILQGAKSSKTFIAGLAGIMGVDLLGDGALNMVSQIAASLGMATPVAGWIVAGIVAIGGTMVVLKDINKMQREDLESALLTVNSMYDRIKIQALKHYDEYIDKIRELLENNFMELNGVGKKAIVQHNVKLLINDTINFLDGITKEHAENVYGLGAAIS